MLGSDLNTQTNAVFFTISYIILAILVIRFLAEVYELQSPPLLYIMLGNEWYTVIFIITTPALIMTVLYLLYKAFYYASKWLP